MPIRWGRRTRSGNPAVTREQRRRAAADQEQQRRRHTPSARQFFPALLERLVGSRPVTDVLDEGGHVIARRLGAPTFRNVIEDGELR